MGYATRPDFQPFPASRLQWVKGSPRPNLLALFFNAFFESREREAKRDVQAYLARTGGVAPRSAVRVPRPGLLSRIFDALLDTRRRQAQRDVEAYLSRRGHRLTDSIEREMNEHLFNGSWNSRR